MLENCLENLKFVLSMIICFFDVSIGSMSTRLFQELRTPRNRVIVSLAISDSLLALFQVAETFLRPLYVGWFSLVTAMPQVFVLNSYLHLLLLAVDRSVQLTQRCEKPKIDRDCPDENNLISSRPLPLFFLPVRPC